MKKIMLAILFTSVFAKADTYNFRFSPIHALVGYVNAGLDVEVHPNWTLGPSLGLWNFNSSSLSDSALSTTSYNYRYLTVGARANWFVNGVYKDGLYIGPHFEFINMSAKSSTNASDFSGTAKATIVGAYVGYGWFWESFNQMLAGGLRGTAGDTKISIYDGTGAKVDESKGTSFTGFSIEYTLGWTF